MACNCASSEQIKELYRRYGDKKKTSKESFGRKVKRIMTYVGVGLLMIPITPCLFLYVLYKGLCDDDHKISLTKFFRLDKKKIGYAGQQNI